YRMALTTLFHLSGESTCLTQISSSGSTYYKDFPGLDSSSAKVWIYPTNYPIRDYQLKISEAALFQNTLVCLPTGLGKTFIAAVVMYNFYRWYPSGKIVFMAPTKPLVAQQIEACYNVMGIPQTHMAELTGSTQAQHRQELWRSRRIFFLTPQVLCVVIDEAHKALGNHAYCQVVRQLGSQTQQFRILALSATPGGDTNSVQQVISNLLISHIELRSEESPDIQAHSHQRSLEKVVVPLGESLAGHQALYLQVLERFTGRLIQNRAMSHHDLRSLTKYQLILAREQFRKNPPPHVMGAQQGVLEGDFALCISLYHGYELLLQMGLRSLFLYVQGIMDGTKEKSRARNELQRNATFMDLYQEMAAMFVKPTGPEEPFIYSHPKLQKLEEVVLGHFKTWAESSSTVSTRVMIFSSFRESVQEIAAMLNRHLPLVKVMTFMGQASAGKGVKGFTQKEQLEVMRMFREGGFNTLVSTCVGEEGLDIGEVDLIVCFDAQKSPIRLVQRMGRTGRKRQGRIVVILAEGREERTYNQSQSNKRKVYKSIVGNSHSFHMFPHNPRMLPDGVHPALHKMHITCGQFDHRESSGRIKTASPLCFNDPVGHQESVKKDGFLSPSELTHWESTMKLGEGEAPPILRRSRFLSKQEGSPPRVELLSSGPTRELSLWEWRHWQNQPFPTHIVDHSNRCHHFTKVMELIDGLRQEEVRGRATSEGRIMDMDFDCIILDNESENSEVNSPRDLESESVNCIAAVEQIDLNQLTSIADREPKSDEDSELEALFYLPKWDAAVPKLQPLRQKLESLRVILVNVTELLSRSPPALHFDLDSPQFDPGPTPFTTKDCSHTLPVEPLDELLDVGQTFHVNFSLEVDEDFDDPASQSPNVDLDVGSLDCESHCEPPHQQHSPSSPITVPAESMGRESALGSPSWDEVFEDDSNDIKEDDMDDKADFKPPCHPTQLKARHSKTNLDESMDLFGDDGTFLQMTIPDIPTPENVSIRIPSPLKAPEREWLIGSSKSVTETKMVYQVKPSCSHASPVAQQEPAQDFENFVCSQDLFSVNFDLGWEEDEGDTEAAPSQFPSKTSPHGSKKQEAPLSSTVNEPKISGSSTPPFSFHRKSVSTPLTACLGRKRADTSALASPQTSPLTFKSGALNTVIYFFESTFPSQQAVQHHHRGARHFLDEEAALSEGGEVSSDEEDGEEQNRSLEGFVVSNTQCSQGINDSEMQGVYLKSVRSPAVAGKFKMIYKLHPNMDIFSQVPELDETYAEDSFVVRASDEEELGEEDEEVPLELIYEDSFVEGRRQYPTRRKALIRNIRAQAGSGPATLDKRAADPQPNPAGKNKRSRIVHLEDSSSEEEVEKSRHGVKAEGVAAICRLSELQCRQRLHQQALLSEELDFEHKPPASSSNPSGLVAVLVDSRCITACVDVVSSLRQRCAVAAHVCSLDGCDFVVSNRMAVERQCQSELAGMPNRKRLVERVTSLQSLFERVCLIVEKDRTKPSEASRPFQPTRYYDSTLASLVRAGVRLLVSRGPEESATLLAELARMEQRKGQAISVPLEVKGHRQQALLFYRTLPCVSYVNALNMSHSFRSVGHLVNSSIEALQKGACVSRPRAEEIYRCLRYSCDTTRMTKNTPGKNNL
uniref:Fanconi anemia group M protein n=1 Tax=Oncorhynchus mykiss TaxID=8022 RepID=A0A8C7SBF3_ONCMY